MKRGENNSFDKDLQYQEVITEMIACFDIISIINSKLSGPLSILSGRPEYVDVFDRFFNIFSTSFGRCLDNIHVYVNNKRI